MQFLAIFFLLIVLSKEKELAERKAKEAYEQKIMESKK
jgi:hypothetical protein